MPPAAVDVASSIFASSCSLGEAQSSLLMFYHITNTIIFIAKVITIVITVSITVVIVATSMTLHFRMNGRQISGSGHLELSGLDQEDFCFSCYCRFLVGFFFEVEIQL